MAVQVITMKIILAAVFGIFLFCAVAKADDCISVDSFVTEFAKEGIHLRGTTAAATAKMAEVFNANREASGQPKAEISLFLFGPVTNAAGEVVIVAAVVGKDGCVIKRSVAILTLREFSIFASKSGISPKDLIPMDGA